jgi:hypothetical protein
MGKPKQKRRARSLIVKVQISLFTTETTRQMLVYDRRKSVVFQGDVTQEVLDEMEGDPKAFFHATHRRDGAIELHRRAPWQEW